MSNRFIDEFKPASTDIAVCGSMKHATEMKDIIHRLHSMGFSVSTPDLEAEPVDYTAMQDQKHIGHTKGHWVRRHFANIAQASCVLVVNCEKDGINGYIGANTLIEMAAGYIYDKPIFVLNPISPQPSYEEILGLEPICINSDLEKIKVKR